MCSIFCFGSLRDKVAWTPVHCARQNCSPTATEFPLKTTGLVIKYIDQYRDKLSLRERINGKSPADAGYRLQKVAATANQTCLCGDPGTKFWPVKSGSNGSSKGLQTAQTRQKPLTGEVLRQHKESKAVDNP